MFEQCAQCVHLTIIFSKVQNSPVCHIREYFFQHRTPVKRILFSCTSTLMPHSCYRRRFHSPVATSYSSFLLCTKPNFVKAYHHVINFISWPFGAFHCVLSASIRARSRWGMMKSNLSSVWSRQSLGESRKRRWRA